MKRVSRVVIIVLHFVMGSLFLVMGSFWGWLTILAGPSLLTNKRWGWWLALLSDFVVTGTFVYMVVGVGWKTSWPVTGCGCDVNHRPCYAGFTHDKKVLRENNCRGLGPYFILSRKPLM